MAIVEKFQAYTISPSIVLLLSLYTHNDDTDTSNSLRRSDAHMRQ